MKNPIKVFNAIVTACIGFTVISMFTEIIYPDSRPDTTQSAAKRWETCVSLITNEPNIVVMNDTNFEFTYYTTNDLNIATDSISITPFRISTMDNFDSIDLNLDGQPTTLYWSNGSYHISK